MAARTVAIVQARFGSARLPGKALRPLQGRPMIHHVLERASAIGTDAVVLATTDLGRDDLVAEAAATAAQHRGCGIPVVRGSEDDVLARVFAAAQLAQADTIIRVTGDCPFLAPDVAQWVLAYYDELLAAGEHVDYCWNDTLRSGFPDGTDVEVFSMAALTDAAAHAWRPGDREHVTPWIRRHRTVGTLTALTDLSRLKLSVDDAYDYARAQKIAAALGAGALALRDTIAAATAVGEWTAP